MTMLNQRFDEITTELFLSRRAGTLTPERYLDLERQAFVELEQVFASLPEDVQWLRDDLRAEVTRYKPEIVQQALAR